MSSWKFQLRFLRGCHYKDVVYPLTRFNCHDYIIPGASRMPMVVVAHITSAQKLSMKTKLMLLAFLLLFLSYF
jgi:hypothetical protein